MSAESGGELGYRHGGARRGMLARARGALLKRVGPTDARRRVWDEEWRSGHWDFLDRPVEDHPVHDVLRRYWDAATVLDLGCGSGTASLQLPPTFERYLGVDIAEAAVERGNARLRLDPERREKASLVVADIADFDPGSTFSLIQYRECLYYFRRSDLRRMLERYMAFLAPEGVCVAGLWDRTRYAGIVNLICRTYDVVESVTDPRGGAIVLVFRPTASAGRARRWDG